ncbi:uncharacterized protein F4822DRAFT_430866 [Hypoxylon trugodes]|uniref:uncharacterized protein n=1 Tax=Hypoxylon trugodes TaxID=326681 RepID=UPI00218DCF8A|nr:uncharacterized protein F4822DRAFT_430866 [Hypoxylon trugodes]KAI1388111.1 hypothetical protein F4822DRAFT_430866 [Hypoxylon trugodes]
MSFGVNSTEVQGEASNIAPVNLTNYFNNLSVEEPLNPSYDILGDAHHTDSSDVPKTTKYIVEPQKSRYDSLFALYQLFRDIKEIRARIMEVWDGVFDEETEIKRPLTAAALVSSCGVSDGLCASFSMKNDEIRERNRERDKAKKKPGNVRLRLSPTELLKSLCLSCQAEGPKFVFPYLVLIQMAWECLERVRVSCEPYLYLNFPEYEGESGLVQDFVLPILCAAPQGLGSEALRKAGAAVEEFLHQDYRDEAVRCIRQAMGLTFAWTNGFTVSQYEKAPRPSEEEIATFRRLTRVDHLFAS